MLQAKIKSSLIFIIPAIVLIAGMVIFWPKSFKPEVIQVQPVKTTRPAPAKSNFTVSFDQEKFYATLTPTGPVKDFKGQVCGGIVPHHDLAGSLITNFFSQLKAKVDPKTIILLGPNHADAGLAPGITANFNWQTPEGTIGNNDQIMMELIEKNIIAFDEDNFKPEHSLQVLMPYLAHYFPEAKIVPIIFTSKYGYRQALNLGVKLNDYLADDQTIIIASLDFSHYLTSEQTLVKDQETEKLIAESDYQKIWRLKSDHLDSPISLLVLLKAMETAGCQKQILLDHQEMGQLLGIPQKSSTSYYTMFFYR